MSEPKTVDQLVRYYRKLELDFEDLVDAADEAMRQWAMELARGGVRPQIEFLVEQWGEDKVREHFETRAEEGP